jgi:Zn-dependent protease with chaperone function
MEPEIVEVEAAVKALAVLSAIPVVLFALWADHFEKYINELCIKNPQFDRKVEIEKVRIASLCVILFLFSLFIGSPEIRRAYPLISQLVFCTGTLAQLWLQSRMEKKIGSSGQKIDHMIGIIAKATVSWLVGAFIYVFTVLLSLRGSMWIAHLAHLSPNASTFVFCASGVLGILGGLALNFGLAPFFIKKTLPVASIQDPVLLSWLQQCYSKAKLKVPQLWIIELHQLHIAHTILAGFQRGKGIFRPALFIARASLDLLHPTEVEAIVLNQISNVTLNHLRKKFVLTSSLLFSTILTSIATTVFAKVYFPQVPSLGMVGPITAIAGFFLSYKLLTDQIKNHQLKADIYCIEKLGVSAKDLFQALRKMDKPHEKKEAPKQGFPDTERRIQRLKDYINQNNVSIETPSEETVLKKAG